jgi:DNA-binding protein HU-beta
LVDVSFFQEEMSTVNKSELIQAVADGSGLSRADATRATDSLLDAITQALKGKDEVRLIGFGTFSVAHRKATQGRNPQTGAPIQLKASNQPKFKPGKGLKDAVN